MPEKKPYRLLLINPWIYDFTAFDLWSKPIGLLYIASYLRKIGYEIDYLDCLDKYNPLFLKWPGCKKPKVKKYGVGPFYRQIVNKPAILDFVPRHFARYGMPEEIFNQHLHGLNIPDAVLITSLMTYWYPGPKRVVELVRDVFPGVPVILGGIYTTLMPKHATEVIKPDYIMRGPGEIQIAEMLNNIIPKSPVDNMPPEYLDDFPPPAFDLYLHLDYLPVMTSRGCPYRCTFCATDKISGKFAQRKPDRVVHEIAQQTRQYQVKDVAFYDDALLLNKNRSLIPILEALIDAKVHLRFHTPNGLHAKEIDEDIARLFYLSGFTTIRMSFESVNPERLADMKNKVTVEDLKCAVKNLERAGYKRKTLEAYILMGLPGQSIEEVYQSLLFVHSVGIKVRLASYSPIPGTIDFERAVNQGLFPADADPLLTNKTIYPLHRTVEEYWKFNRIRQLVNVLNQGIDKGVNLVSTAELRNAFKTIINGNKSLHF